MFLDFFYKLRKAGLPSGTGELMDLFRALSGYAEKNLPVTAEKFYFISRACLAKDEKHFDSFDRVFAETFRDALESGDAFRNILEEWLKEAKKRSSAEGGPEYETEQLWKELEDRLRTQTERHDGGSKWIGTGGVSPFGHSGENPKGLRIGGEGSNRSAMDVLTSGRYREYSEDEKLGVRGFRIALRRLRDLRREGRPEFDLPETIRETSNSGGDPVAVFRRSRKNRMTLVLLTDVGGSMTPYSGLVSRLFTAASKLAHFREFKHYYFHNAVYDHVFLDAAFRKPLSIEDFYKKFDQEARLLFAGDACMNPYELFDKRHAYFEYYYRARMKQDNPAERDVLSAYGRFQEIARKYPHCAWMNPEPRRAWWHETISAIGDVIPMYPFTIAGLHGAVRRLMQK